MAAPDFDALAEELHSAWVTASPITPLTRRHPDLTVDDAYEVQHRLLARLSGAGEAVSGYKVGLTSTAMQEMLGVDEPDYSALLPSMRVPSGGTIPRDRLVRPKAEAEICVILGKPLQGPDVTAGEVRRAAAGITAAVEVIDSRIADWDIRIVDTVADIASTARHVVSDEIVPLDGFDPRLIGVVVHKNGTMVATGAGAAALGDPFQAAAWTINTLARYGVTVHGGQLILTGAVHGAFDVEAGDEVVATFDRLGAVSVGFA